MSAEGCTAVKYFGTVDDNLENVQWCDSTEVNYNPANQSTYELNGPYSSNTQYPEKKNSQAFTAITMFPEETEGMVIGPATDVK